MIDATPTGLVRNPAALARVSVVAKLHVVATTGAHCEAHYSPVHWLLDLTEAQLADRFIADITDGMPATDTAHRAAPARTGEGNPIRAGIFKAGIDYWSISDFERRVLRASPKCTPKPGRR